jgi:hypothetical protein
VIGARTIRKKINDKLDEFLTEFPPVIAHPHPAKTKAKVKSSSKKKKNSLSNILVVDNSTSQ